MTTITTLDVDALRSAPDAVSVLTAAFADDVEWTDVHAEQRRVYRGRAAVTAMLHGIEESGIASRVVDGFAAGDRAALTVHCVLPDGGVIVTNALLELRGGSIVRWFGAEAMDER